MTSHLVEPFSYPVLMGDIGGTNVRFSILTDAFAEPRPFEPIQTADFPDIETAIQTVVCDMTSTIPRSAVIAAAGPVAADALDLTNADWVIKPRQVIEAIGLEDIVLLNDFEAQALAVTALNPEDLEAVGEGEAIASGPKVIVGPGTGLGVAGLLNVGGMWAPVPGEGGHMSLGPQNSDEFPVFEIFAARGERVSAEFLLAGQGIVRLHQAVAEVNGQSGELSQPNEITGEALANRDSLAGKTLSLYCRLLGRVVGDLALVFIATGGVYIGGGIIPKILPILHEGEFRRGFEAKDLHSDLLASIPTMVITAPRAAMHGLSAFSRTPSRFGVSLDGRRWRSRESV